MGTYAHFLLLAALNGLDPEYSINSNFNSNNFEPSYYSFSDSNNIKGPVLVTTYKSFFSTPVTRRMQTLYLKN